MNSWSFHYQIWGLRCSGQIIRHRGLRNRFLLASGAPRPTRRILGHERIGRVAQVSSALTAEPLAKKLASHEFAMFGHYAMCLKEKGGWLKQFRSGRKIDGTFAQYTVVSSRYLIPVPEGSPDEHLARIMCAGATAYKTQNLRSDAGAVDGSFRRWWSGLWPGIAVRPLNGVPEDYHRCW